MKKNTPIATLITDIEQELLTIYDDATLCRQYAWWTIETITHQKKAALIAQENLTLTEQQQERLELWLRRLIDKKEPIQYLIGSVPFNNVEILVEPPVLIPRPETEEWTFQLTQKLKHIQCTNLTILDMCCGSGCIAVSMAHELKNARVTAADLAPHAIELTKKNIAHNNIKNMSVIYSDLFDRIPAEKQFDLIVCNPPYIAPDAWENLEPSVKNWEDKNALTAPDDGLETIKRIIHQAPAYIRANNECAQKNMPQLVLEIGYDQGPVVMALMRAALYTHVEIHTDLEGKDRVVSGRINHAPATAD